MTANPRRLFLGVWLSVALSAVALTAQTPEAQPEPATLPVPRNDWLKRHLGFVNLAQQGGIDVLFLGDSITDGWRDEKDGAPVWKKYF